METTINMSLRKIALTKKGANYLNNARQTKDKYYSTISPISFTSRVFKEGDTLVWPGALVELLNMTYGYGTLFTIILKIGKMRSREFQTLIYEIKN